MRRILFPVLFLFAAGGLYAAFVALEYYWNVPDWQPRWDNIAALIFAGLGLMLVSVWFLARATKDRISRVLCLVPSLALIALAVYVAGAEPLKPGFLGRESPSPLWYRGGRSVLLCLPAVFCVVRLWRN
jgi:hypothetical protein